jgi:hypothetical protein
LVFSALPFSWCVRLCSGPVAVRLQYILAVQETQ